MSGQAASNASRPATGRLLRNIQKWTRQRRRAHSTPQVISPRSAYILPTRMGLMYAAIVFVLFIGSINYGNNLGFMLTFLLAAQGVVCMWQTQRNLVGVRVHPPKGESGFVNAALHFGYRLENPTGRTRYALRLELGDSASNWVDVEAEQTTQASLRYTPDRRGWTPGIPIRVESRYPLGLFYAWTWIEFHPTQLAYPMPMGDATPPLGGTTAGAHSNKGQGDEELAAIREYRPGDPRHTRAWKASARLDRPMTLQWQGACDRTAEFDLDTVPDQDLECKLSQLARWIVDAEDHGVVYGLILPGYTIPPGSGSEHRTRCLNALALYPNTAARP